MCIIAVKPANKPMPDASIISTMWKRNSDGAGFMYAHKGKVYICKGFMHFEKLQRALERIPPNVPVVLHFRIATHGGISPAMCHPFPLTDDIKRLKATNQTAKVGIAHNGIIPIRPRKGLSDTAEYIAAQLAPLSKALPRWYQNPHALQMVENGIQSRMAILSGAGELVTLGKGWVEDGGIKYSNASYMPWDEPEGWGEKLLMPLYSDECYLSVGGDMVEADETAMDESGNIYFFDYDYCAWREACVSCTAFRHNGTPVRFSEALAEPMDILEWEPI